MIALIDIDGTIADCFHRLKFIQPKFCCATCGEYPNPGEHECNRHSFRTTLVEKYDPDWTAFFNAMDKDAPIHSVIKLVRAISQIYDITYITGRPMSHRDVTLNWLRENRLPLGNLVMRATGDHRPDFEVKEELYNDYVIPFIGVADIVIEDRDQVVEMWRAMGITCLQPCKGSY